MTKLPDLIHWFQQKNRTTPELRLTDGPKLQLLLNYAQAMYCAVFGEPLFSEPFPHPELLFREAALYGGGDFSSPLDHNTTLILKIITFLYGPKTVPQLQSTAPPEDAWRRLELAQQITNLEIKTQTIKACFPGFQDIFDAYHGLDFENQVVTVANGNTFTFNSRQLNLTNADRETLHQIGNATRGYSYYLHQNQDGSLEITEI
jgi:hypothetical protein